MAINYTFLNQRNMFPQKITIPTQNRMLLPNDPYIDHIIRDNKVYKICRIVYQIPVNHFLDKPTTDQLYDWFNLDEVGIWFVEHILNDIIVEKISRHDIMEDRYYVSGRVMEKDYTFYALKWG